MQNRLLVLPNPGHTKDHLGRPACAIPADPLEHTSFRRWIGAKPKTSVKRPKVTRMIGGQLTTLVEADYDIEWEFSATPVEIPNTGYYRDRLKEGSLLPADEATAKAAGIKFSAASKEQKK